MKINSILSLRNVNPYTQTLRKILAVSLLIITFALTAANAKAAFKVIGYMPSWSGNVNTVQYNKLTHINYAFLLPTSTGGLQPIENPNKLQNLVSTAHTKGVKVLISVGGWNNGNDQGFESLAANSTYRNNFVNNIVNFVSQYGLDGVDIDWEYPDPGASANNYVALMTQLSNAMHSRGKLLTAAVVGDGGASILSSVFPLVDYIMLMAYDYNNFDHSTYAYAQLSLNYWRGRGLPKDKAILGVPFYGRPSWESYAQLLARGASPNADIFNGVFYNGIPTIRSKTNLAFDQGGGIMMWELSQDATGTNSLLSAIHEVRLQREAAAPASVADADRTANLVIAPKPDENAGKEAGATIFPNPVTKGSPITVKLQDYDSKAPVQISVLDLNKKILATAKANTQTISVATSNIPGGYYLIVITNGRNSFTRRVLVL